MTAWLIDGLSWLALIAGAIFMMIAGVGMLRLPDFFTRMHAASITETGGMLLITIGLLLQTPDLGVGIRLFLVAALLLFTNPTATHALAHAALKDGLRPTETRAGRR